MALRPMNAPKEPGLHDRLLVKPFTVTSLRYALDALLPGRARAAG